MPIVLLLRGVNVGGHRRFRPRTFAGDLAHLDVVSLGAAGTFVVRGRVTQAQLRVEVRKRLPFATVSVTCPGAEIIDLVRRDPFAGIAVGRDTVPFVSVLARRPRAAPRVPILLPSARWVVRILGHHGRFVYGLHRRRMQAIGLLGQIDRLFGAPATTRGWRTITDIVRVLEA